MLSLCVCMCVYTHAHIRYTCVPFLKSIRGKLHTSAFIPESSCVYLLRIGTQSEHSCQRHKLNMDSTRISIWSADPKSFKIQSRVRCCVLFSCLHSTRSSPSPQYFVCVMTHTSGKCSFLPTWHEVSLRVCPHDFIGFQPSPPQPSFLG